MRSPNAIILILAVWSLIYLSHLGERELRGEEARRIIPAQEMIANDQWIVPTIAGEVYGNKPPLINWLIAGSFLVTGSQSEWAARLPSVLSLLCLALAAFFLLRKELGSEKSAAVSFVLLTACTMVIKCRMAEIESIFVALFGFACLSWIALWTRKKSPWLIWTIPYIFIGLGFLAKGPVHILFWILFLIPTLRFSRSLKEAFHPAHLLGIIIAAAITLPWVMANLSGVENPDDSVNNWIRELTMRLDFSPEARQGWVEHPFKLLLHFFPWTIPLGFALWCLRKDPKPELPLSRWDAVLRGSFWSIALAAIALLSIPGGLPRYILPLYPLAAILLVSLYFRVEEGKRSGYEKFVYYSLLVASILVFGAFGVGIYFSLQKGLSPLWVSLTAAFLIFVGVTTWIFREKNRLGGFITVPVFVASAYFLISTITIPFERTEYQFREGARKIESLSSEVSGTKVFYADTRFRTTRAKLLRLNYYLGDNFVDQGESRELPPSTEFLIGRTGSVPRMRALAEGFHIENEIEMAFEKITFTAFFLQPQSSDTEENQ